MVNGGRDCRIADAHFAEAQKIDMSGDGLHPESERRRGLLFFQGRGLANVPCRNVERQIENLQAEPMGRADLVDRGASGAKIVHHGAGDRGRIGRHDFLHDTVIAGEHRDERPIDRRLRLPLPSSQEPGDFLEPAERPRRLGQFRLARVNRLLGRLRRLGQGGNEIADRVKWRFCGGHRDLREQTTSVLTH